MSLLDFLPAREERATANQAAVTSATCDCAKPSMTPEQQKEKEERKGQETIGDLKISIIRAHYLWDMRCWERFHDPEEIRAWIRNKCQPNNSGHAVYCIQELMENHNFSEDQIVELVMQNNNRVFPNRLAKCFHDGNSCPIAREKGNYSDCNCSERCGGKAPSALNRPVFVAEDTRLFLESVSDYERFEASGAGIKAAAEVLRRHGIQAEAKAETDKEVASYQG